MNVMIPRLVLGAPASGCGKSTVATGLMAALVFALLVPETLKKRQPAMRRSEKA